MTNPGDKAKRRGSKHSAPSGSQHHKHHKKDPANNIYLTEENPDGHKIHQLRARTPKKEYGESSGSESDESGAGAERKVRKFNQGDAVLLDNLGNGKHREVARAEVEDTSHLASNASYAPGQEPWDPPARTPTKLFGGGHSYNFSSGKTATIRNQEEQYQAMTPTRGSSVFASHREAPQTSAAPSTSVMFTSEDYCYTSEQQF